MIQFVSQDFGSLTLVFAFSTFSHHASPARWWEFIAEGQSHKRLMPSMISILNPSDGIAGEFRIKGFCRLLEDPVPQPGSFLERMGNDLGGLTFRFDFPRDRAGGVDK